MLEKLIGREKLGQYFRVLPPVLRLVRYEKGEYILSPLEKLEQFLFVVQGQVKIYGLQEDGRMYRVAMSGRRAVLGDLEFCGREGLPLFAEAVGTVLCIAVPFRPNREVLQEDPVFLRFLLDRMAEKLERSSWLELPAGPLEEKLMRYLRRCGGVTGVNDTLMHLHCSRRQLQRVLKKLTEGGQLQKIGKGCYRLADERPEGSQQPKKS